MVTAARDLCDGHGARVKDSRVQTEFDGMYPGVAWDDTAHSSTSTGPLVK